MAGWLLGVQASGDGGSSARLAHGQREEAFGEAKGPSRVMQYLRVRLLIIMLFLAFMYDN